MHVGNGSRCLALGALLAACSAKSNENIAPTGDTDTSRIEDPCGLVCDRLVECQLENDAAACLGQCGPLAQRFADAFVQAWAVCTRDTACEDLFTTDTQCGAGGCSSSTVNNCLVSSTAAVPASVVEPLLAATCAHYIDCAVAPSDSVCRDTFNSGEALLGLRAYPDADLTCVTTCMTALSCAELSSDPEALLIGCANDSCDLDLGK